MFRRLRAFLQRDLGHRDRAVHLVQRAFRRVGHVAAVAPCFGGDFTALRPHADAEIIHEVVGVAAVVSEDSHHRGEVLVRHRAPANLVIGMPEDGAFVVLPHEDAAGGEPVHGLEIICAVAPPVEALVLPRFRGVHGRGAARVEEKCGHLQRPVADVFVGHVEADRILGAQRLLARENEGLRELELVRVVGALESDGVLDFVHRHFPRQLQHRFVARFLARRADCDRAEFIDDNRRAILLVLEMLHQRAADDAAAVRRELVLDRAGHAPEHLALLGLGIRGSGRGCRSRPRSRSGRPRGRCRRRGARLRGRRAAGSGRERRQLCLFLCGLFVLDRLVGFLVLLLERPVIELVP